MPLVSSEMNRFFDAKGTDMLLSLLYHVLSFFSLNISDIFRPDRNRTGLYRKPVMIGFACLANVLIGIDH